jgi:branched-chain amino acid transport system permease protein
MVYGVLFMINFAHGDVLMIGSMAGWAIPPARSRRSPALPSSFSSSR